jgi:hypothetical protein
MSDENLQRWHQVVFNKDKELLRELLHDDVIFRTPTLWSPKPGKEVAAFILETVLDLFEDFQYRRQWIDGNDWSLEFVTSVQGKGIKGVDLITWNDEGQIIEFEVIIRPLNSLQLLFQLMSERLAKAGLV